MPGHRRQGRHERARGARAAPASKAEERATELGVSWTPTGFPVEYLALGGIGPGVPVRATLSDFGPQLLGKILKANETQEQSLQLVFHYADTKGLPLLDLSDLRALLTYLDSDAGKPELAGIGGLAGATVGVLLRSLDRAGDRRRERALRRTAARRRRPHADRRGRARDHLLPRARRLQDKPRLFSTALMWLLAELFESLPEAGDLPQPKLAFFFDEAHLLFADATDAFVESVVQTVRLIRSKGVGVFFVTQTPKDIPADVLGQLGNRVQHALRAFTPDDAKALKASVGTYPKSELLRPRGAAARARDRRGDRHRPRRPRACRRRSCTRASARPPRGWRPPTTSTAPPSLASVGEVRRADRGRERARAAHRAGCRTRPRGRGRRGGRGPSRRRRAARAHPGAEGAPTRAGPAEVRRRARRLPLLPAGQAAAEGGHARRLRDAPEAASRSESRSPPPRRTRASAP